MRHVIFQDDFFWVASQPTLFSSLVDTKYELDRPVMKDSLNVVPELA
ncbi:hypothetical protein OAL43_01620 [bacterium]|nr:hypothetical protein [bacterium]